jgi:hypothetical protein
VHLKTVAAMVNMNPSVMSEKFTRACTTHHYMVKCSTFFFKEQGNLGLKIKNNKIGTHI